MGWGIIAFNCIQLYAVNRTQPISSTSLGHLGAEITIDPLKGTVRRKVANRYDSPRSQNDRYIE